MKRLLLALIAISFALPVFASEAEYVKAYRKMYIPGGTERRMTLEEAEELRKKGLMRRGPLVYPSAKSVAAEREAAIESFKAYKKAE